MENTITIGDFVIHKLTGERCMVIRKGKEQFQIRTPNYKEVWVYEMEITKVN